MKSFLISVLIVVGTFLMRAENIPASILSRTVTEPDWQRFGNNLCREVAKWHTPTHEPELVAKIWEPLLYLRPNYYFVEGKFLGEIEICKGSWFAAYRGKQVSDLIAIGTANRDEYTKKPLALKEAVQMCLEANWNSGCHAFLAIDQGMGEISFPGLEQTQVDSLTASDSQIVLHEDGAFVVDDVQHTETKRRITLLRFIELYNKALFQKRAVPTKTMTGADY